VITLPEASDARDRVATEFEDLGYIEYSFVPGFQKENVDSVLIGSSKSPVLEKRQLAATIAHIQAIKHWIESTTEQIAIIMEDDISMELIPFWSFSWKEFYERLPEKFDIIQLCVLKPKLGEIKFKPRHFDNSYTSAACYLITRSYGEEILKRHLVKNKFDLRPFTPGLNSVVDELIYDTGGAYLCPIFIFNDFDLDDRVGNTLGHGETHQIAYKRVIDLWTSHAPKSVNDLF
jgi:hypothetical protein